MCQIASHQIEASSARLTYFLELHRGVACSLSRFAYPVLSSSSSRAFCMQSLMHWPLCLHEWTKAGLWGGDLYNGVPYPRSSSEFMAEVRLEPMKPWITAYFSLIFSFLPICLKPSEVPSLYIGHNCDPSIAYWNHWKSLTSKIPNSNCV